VLGVKGDLPSLKIEIRAKGTSCISKKGFGGGQIADRARRGPIAGIMAGVRGVRGETSLCSIRKILGSGGNQKKGLYE